MSELKPCPHCGGTDLQIVETDMTCCIRCCTKGCWMEGPTKEWKDSAIEAWNALPRPLRWMKEQPTEPGWYFCQRICKYVENKYPLRVVHIHYDVVMGQRILCSGGCAWYGVEDDRQDSYPLCDISKRALEEMWWAGPIQEPVE